jgi:hypothetical protein
MPHEPSPTQREPELQSVNTPLSEMKVADSWMDKEYPWVPHMMDDHNFPATQREEASREQCPLHKVYFNHRCPYCLMDVEVDAHFAEPAAAPEGAPRVVFDLESREDALACVESLKDALRTLREERDRALEALREAADELINYQIRPLARILRARRTIDHFLANPAPRLSPAPERRHQLRNWHHVTCTGFGGGACTCLAAREALIAELAR